ncbi:hypothetical protein OCGS_1896 [Oceaniovalibus guishaninsula JLT2003]|uniref:BrnA antitoxin of type II toxin-antitoxin system n=1 Tax=Oceaniovalibus guishaninsula JLT2003 TaxID=1231392 RepID=K2I4R4_9RHOB|nr:BrnA antitoxin family protein [Oceaniovalibus guishaninsula]EKE43915.1 hypothetical protein OCGS_1896 [Oceaniovalibus guishaninsula JLT2003]
MARKLTKTERIVRARMIRNLDRFDDEGTMQYAIRDHCPEAWALIESDIDVEERKVHVTLRLDASVAQFYRAMGKGYQARINRILATWAQMKILKVNELERESAAGLEEMRRIREAREG